MIGGIYKDVGVVRSSYRTVRRTATTAVREVQTRIDQRRLDVAGVALAAGVLAVAAGVPGLVAALAFVVAWASTPPPVAYAVGHLLVLPAFPDGVSLPVLVALELGFASVLLASLVESYPSPVPALVMLVAFVPAAATLWYLGVAFEAFLLPVAVAVVAAGLLLAILSRWEDSVVAALEGDSRDG